MALRDRGLIEVRGLCDLAEPRLASAKRSFPECGFATNEWPALIESARGSGGDGSVAVVVSTPPQTHGEILERCVSSGFHVYADKPLTTNLERARHIVAKAKERQTMLGVGSQRRYERTYRTVRDEIPNLGLIKRIQFHSHGNFAGPVLDSAENNVPWGIGYHVLDTINWLLTDVSAGKGRIDCLSAVQHRWPTWPNYWSGFEALFLWRDGDRAFPIVVSCSMLSPPNTVDESLVIVGERGELRLQRQQAPRTMDPARVSRAYWSDPAGKLVVVDLNSPDAKAERAAPLEDMILCLSDAAGRPPLQSTGESALLTLEMIDQLERKAVPVG
jgi:predicted dehydrogenase